MANWLLKISAFFSKSDISLYQNLSFHSWYYDDLFHRSTAYFHRTGIWGKYLIDVTWWFIHKVYWFINYLTLTLKA